MDSIPDHIETIDPDPVPVAVNNSNGGIVNPDDEKEIIRPLSAVRDAPPLRPLWGNWIFEDSVIMLVGEPGIKKTTFLYNLALKLVDNEPFLGVKATVPTVRIIYCDFESGDSLVRARVEALGDYPKDDNSFLLVNEKGLTFTHAIPRITKWVKARPTFPTMVIIDCIRAAFDMRDENDNAEASKQMVNVRNLMNDISPCAIFLVHHSSKAEMSGTRKGSGAGARSALADILWNFEKEEDWPDGVFRWVIPKNRLADDHLSVYIKGSQFNFELCPKPRQADDPQSDCGVSGFKLQEKLLNLLLTTYPKDARLLQAETKCTERQFYRAMGCLLVRGEAKRTRHGQYTRSVNGLKPATEEEEMSLQDSLDSIKHGN